MEILQFVGRCISAVTADENAILKSDKAFQIGEMA